MGAFPSSGFFLGGGLIRTVAKSPHYLHTSVRFSACTYHCASNRTDFHEIW